MTKVEYDIIEEIHVKIDKDNKEVNISFINPIDHENIKIKRKYKNKESE